MLPTPSPANDPTCPPDLLAQPYGAFLHELIAMGMDLARHVHRQAQLPADALPARDAPKDPEATLALAGAFERVSRV